MSWHVHAVDEIMVSVLHRLWSIACSRRPMILLTPIALHIQSDILILCLSLALLPSVLFSKMCCLMPSFSRNRCPTMQHCLSLMVRISKQFQLCIFSVFTLNQKKEIVFNISVYKMTVLNFTSCAIYVMFAFLQQLFLCY